MATLVEPSRLKVQTLLESVPRGKKRRRPSAKGKDKRFSSRDTHHMEAEDDEECSDEDGRGSKSESLGSDQMGILLQAINASKKVMDRQLEEFKDEFRRTSCQATVWRSV